MKGTRYIKLLLPPILFKIKNKLFANIFKYKIGLGWFGNYKTWDEARRHCEGYQSDTILLKVKKSLLQVKNNDGYYERDSVLFKKKEFSENLIKALLKAASENDFKLHVLDFGGSLGSTYFQNNFFFEHLSEFTWSIVEQENFVREGKKFFEEEPLKFYLNIESCLIERNVNVLLLSGVLQYLEMPMAFVSKVLKHNFDYILIDRTSFITDDKIRISKQIVPKSIYKASYPIYFFNEHNFIELFSDKYVLISDFSSYCDPRNYFLEDNKIAYWKGFVFRIK